MPYAKTQPNATYPAAGAKHHTICGPAVFAWSLYTTKGLLSSIVETNQALFGSHRGQDGVSFGPCHLPASPRELGYRGGLTEKESTFHPGTNTDFHCSPHPL
jgi:hypothetical protein